MALFRSIAMSLLLLPTVTYAQMNGGQNEKLLEIMTAYFERFDSFKGEPMDNIPSAFHSTYSFDANAIEMIRDDAMFGPSYTIIYTLNGRSQLTDKFDDLKALIDGTLSPAEWTEVKSNQSRALRSYAIRANQYSTLVELTIPRIVDRRQMDITLKIGREFGDRSDFMDGIYRLMSVLNNEDKLTELNYGRPEKFEAFTSYKSKLEMPKNGKVKNIPPQRIANANGQEMEFPGMLLWEIPLLDKDKIGGYDALVNEYFKGYRIMSNDNGGHIMHMILTAEGSEVGMAGSFEQPGFAFGATELAYRIALIKK